MSSFRILQNLDDQGAQYAFYLRQTGKTVQLKTNVADEQPFSSASIIKIPILLAWLALERQGIVSRTELCDLDAEPQIQGAGFSWLLRARQLPYQDILLLMIALSDNLCTNLIIRRAGLDRLNQTFHTVLGLTGTHLQRKLMDYEARARGLDNWITPRDCIRFFDLIGALPSADRAFADSLFAVNQDDLLLMRNIPRDTVTFHHKTGSITGVLHDWGYTDTCDIFLLTQRISDEPAAFAVFGEVGKALKAGG